MGFPSTLWFSPFWSQQLSEMVFSEDSVCKPCSLLKGQSSRSKYSLKKKEKMKRKERKEGSQWGIWGPLPCLFILLCGHRRREAHKSNVHHYIFLFYHYCRPCFIILDVCHVLCVVIWNINSAGTKVHRNVALGCSEAFWSGEWPWVYWLSRSSGENVEVNHSTFMFSVQRWTFFCGYHWSVGDFLSLLNQLINKHIDFKLPWTFYLHLF